MKASQRMLKVLPNTAPESSHNGVLLPPLQTATPEWDANDTNQIRRPISNENIEKISKKRQQELVNVDRASNFGLTSSDPVVRANQLEQNIRFLQEQHQVMLTGLHSEIETLRQRNRDLQFQIVFSKGGVAVLQNSPTSSPEDEAQRKILLSPNQVNITPLQVELLERDVAELRTNLSEARTRNVYLQNIVDDQKKKLSSLENEKLDMAAVGKKIGKENITKNKPADREDSTEELNEKLEDADRLIRRLRRENEEQRKEIVSLRTTVSKTMAENRRSDGGNNTHRNYYRNSQSQTTRFPPLHSHPHPHPHPHPHWKNSSDYQQSRNSDRGGNRLDKESEVVGRPAPTLPHLRDRNNASTSTGYSNPAYNNYQGGNHKRGYYYHRKQDDHRAGNRSSRKEQLYPPENE